jgi:hypothetical protein
MRRNLFFHLYPKAKTFWRWHVEQLVRYAPVWNGRRVIVVVTDDWTESQAEVRSQLAPLCAEIFFLPNDMKLGEVRHFVKILSMLESKDPEEATFYAHGKGVSRDSMLPAIQMWSKAMYDLNLSMPEVIDRKLQVKPAVGAFRVRIQHSGAPWCFAGTFFWLQHSALFSRKWREVEQGRWGVEGYPGRHFKFEESFSTTPDFMPHKDVPSWLYGRENSGGVTDVAIARWKEWLSKEGGCTKA